MGMHADRRAWKLIDRNFQYGLAFRLLIASIALFLAGLVLVFAPSIYLLATTSDPRVLAETAEEFLLLHKRIWPAAIFCFAGAFAYCLLLSRRIAGPVYRINTVLEQLLRNERPERVTFRKNDWFQPTAELLERLAEKLLGSPGGRGTPPGGGGI